MPFKDKGASLCLNMLFNFDFDASILETLIGGRSAIDTPRLSIQNLEQARNFVLAYGYDLNSEEDQRKLWGYHRRAVTFLRSELLGATDRVSSEDIAAKEETRLALPETLSDPNQLKDLSYLLIYASTRGDRPNSLQHWSCAILRVMHVLAHLDNDLFTKYSTEIQSQILKPFQARVRKDPATGIQLGLPGDRERIPLHKFDVKTFKTSNSSVLKLLAKPDALAFSILDKVGVRFVTKHLFDVYRVLRFLIDQHLISYPHVVSDQSNNTVYPLNIFLETMESLTQGRELSPQEIDEILQARLEGASDRASFNEKLNLFSSKDYKFIKFISRKLIRVESLSFFYPFEVQIVDYQSNLKNLSGPSSHEEYKARQRARARVRVFGGGLS